MSTESTTSRIMGGRGAPPAAGTGNSWPRASPWAAGPTSKEGGSGEAPGAGRVSRPSAGAVRGGRSMNGSSALSAVTLY